MSESNSYFDSSDYFKATDEERALVIEHDFKKLASKSKEYTQASPQQQDAIRAAYQRNVEAEAAKSPFNPSSSRASAAQYKANNQGFLPNLWGKAVRSHEEGLAAFELIGDALNPDGTLNPDAAKKSAAYFQKQKEAPVLLEEKRLEADVDKRIKDFNHGDASQKVEAVLGGIWDVITNPKGAMYAGTGSASTITSAFLGGKAASIAAAGLTAATGGAAAPAAPFIVAAGSTAAVGAHAGVQNWLENIQKDLDAAGVPHTEANIKAWVEANPDRVLKHQKTALAYGAGMGVLSSASGFLGGKVATSFERAALRQAGTTVEASVSKAAISELAKETGESVEAITKRYINQEAQKIMSTQTFKSNILQKVKNLGVEIAGEPAEELGARLVSGQEVTAKDLIMETIGGIGAGPYGAAVNKSLYGTEVIADKTKSFVQKVVASTPESRAAAKAQEAEIKVAKVESSSPTNYGFKKDIANTEPTDPKVNDWATPGHKSYDPVKAVTVLAKEENPTVDHYDKTRQVYLDYKKVVDGLYDTYEEQLLQSQALLKKGKNGEAQIYADAAGKTKAIIDEKSKTLEQIAGPVNNLKTRLQEVAKTKPVPAIDPETATVDEVTDHITKALGSHGDTNVLDNAGIDKLLKRKDITDDQRSMLGALTEANIARKNVTDRATNKSISEVRDDIYNGDAGTDFKGVDAYRQGIIHHLEAGRMEEAQKQLDGLKAFRDRHQQKSDEVTDIYNTMVSKNSGNLDVLSEGQQAIYTRRKKENSKFLVHPVASKNYVPTIQEEARALNAEVKLAESLMTVHKNKGQVVASPVVSSTPTANPEASVKSDPINIYSTETHGFAGLSNLKSPPVNYQINGKDFKFNTVEHLYQWMKAKFAGDKESATAIYKSTNGYEAQRLGRKVKRLDKKAWDKVAKEKLEEAMRAMFEQNPKQKELLLKTGDSEITHKNSKFSLGRWEKDFPAILHKLRNEFKNGTVSTLTNTDSSNTASVKMFLTKDDHQQLSDLGYTSEQRNKMKPQEGADIIAKGIKAPTLVDTYAQVVPGVKEKEATKETKESES